MTFQFDKSGRPTVTKAFDDAFSRVLDQLANDLKAGTPAPPQPVSADDLQRVARFILDEAKRSSDRARKEFLAQSAFGIAQLAEEVARGAENRATTTAPEF